MSNEEVVQQLDTFVLNGKTLVQALKSCGIDADNVDDDDQQFVFHVQGLYTDAIRRGR